MEHVFWYLDKDLKKVLHQRVKNSEQNKKVLYVLSLILKFSLP